MEYLNKTGIPSLHTKKEKKMRIFGLMALSALLATACLAPASANLVSNGDFESGTAGWNTWWATWSNSSAITASTVTSGVYSGARSLKLQINGFSSCGVYQQVTVTPGTAYKLDGAWKSPSSSGGWFEAILLDGPMSVFQADDPSVVYNNVVAGYDDGLGHSAPAAFGWEMFSATYGNVPNIVNGTRVASGSTMTVVLKLGGSSKTAYFDEVSLVAVPEPASMLALAGGLGALGMIRRKR